MIPRRAGMPTAWRALLLALTTVVLPAPAHASLTGLGEAKDSVPELTTALPRELPGPCEGELCGEREGVWAETRVRGFELDLHCRLGGEQGLSCAPRRVYGVEYGERASDRSVFTGHYFDTETNLYYAKARYFDPELGRFLSQDSYLGELTSPPSLHRYLYANANPTRYTDRTGHSAEDEEERKATPTPMPAPAPPPPPKTRERVGEKRSDVVQDGAQPVVIHLGKETAEAGALRGELYEKGLVAIREQVKQRIAAGMDPREAVEWGVAAREDLQNMVRDKSHPLAKALAERMKPRGSVSADELISRKGVDGAVEGIGRPNPGVSKWMLRSRVAGNALIIASAAVSAKEVYDAPPEDKWRTLGQESAKTLGAVGGGTLGAKGGATVGTLIEPGFGTGVGAVVGGVGGAIVGSFVTEKAFDQVYEYTVPQ